MLGFSETHLDLIAKLWSSNKNLICYIKIRKYIDALHIT